MLCKADSAAKEVALLHMQCYKANQPGQVRSMVPVTDPWGLLQTYGAQIRQGKNHYHSTKASTFNIIIQHYHSRKTKLSRWSFAYPEKCPVLAIFCKLLFTKVDKLILFCSNVVMLEFRYQQISYKSFCTLPFHSYT